MGSLSNYLVGQGFVLEFQNFFTKGKKSMVFNTLHLFTVHFKRCIEKPAMHYAEVVEIRISKCPTLTNYFSAVYHPGCPKFCVELYELSKNIGKLKKLNSDKKKRRKNAKNMKGVFAKVTTGLKKSVLINSTIFALRIFFANTP